jgi:hypothetical protein
MHRERGKLRAPFRPQHLHEQPNQKRIAGVDSRLQDAVNGDAVVGNPVADENTRVAAPAVIVPFSVGVSSAIPSV